LKTKDLNFGSETKSVQMAENKGSNGFGTECSNSEDRRSVLNAEVKQNADVERRLRRWRGLSWRAKIIFDFTPEVRFTEAKSSEWQKIAGERLLAAANDDGPKWENERMEIGDSTQPRSATLDR
jgi:hypothetical protein